MDLVVYRTNHNPPQAFGYLTDLLSWHTIKLIIPEIVTVEIYRRLDDIINNTGENIGALIKQMESSFWINADENAALEYNKKVNEVCKELKKYKEDFKTNNGSYKKTMKGKLDSIFYGPSTLPIKTDEYLVNCVYKRKIFKRCPFHKNVEADADALILETLLNIKKYIKEFSSDDEVYFITRNYKEFSVGENNKEVFHDHIIGDLTNEGLESNVKYSPFFYKTLKCNFNMEYIDAKILEHDSLYYDGYDDWRSDVMDMMEDPHYSHLWESPII